MTWAAKGLFIELLALCWDNEGLPLDEIMLRRMAGVATQTWKIIWPQVRPQFSKVNGRLWNPKILKIWLDLQRISEIRSQAARQTERNGFVYAAIKTGAKLVKIGITNNPKRRLSALRKDIPPGEAKSDAGFPNWETVKLIGVKRGHGALERQAHADLMTENIGGEWFRATGKTLQWVSDHLSDNLNIINESFEQMASKEETKDQQTERLHLQSASSSSFAFAEPMKKDEGLEAMKSTRAQNRRETDLPGFNLFWEAYPRKTAKPDAQRAWLSKVRDDKLWPDVLAGLEKWKLCEQWQTIAFVPHPATFLNRRGWEDEPLKNGGSNGANQKNRQGPGAVHSEPGKKYREPVTYEV